MPLSALAEPHRLEQIARGISAVNHGGSARSVETVILGGPCGLGQTVSSLRLPDCGGSSTGKGKCRGLGRLTTTEAEADEAAEDGGGTGKLLMQRQN